ncbi:MAG: phosphonate C-P lyase system protein PhnG [Pararhodobacter sp.]
MNPAPQPDPAIPSPLDQCRRAALGLLSRAEPRRLVALLDGFLPDPPVVTLLRTPEIGAVMVRGRQGASGAPFNLGEMTVTRCSLRLACGAVGHGYVQGRDKSHARRVALADALMQTPQADALRAAVLVPLEAAERARKAARAARAAATRVEFFTMVRGEDQ